MGIRDGWSLIRTANAAPESNYDVPLEKRKETSIKNAILESLENHSPEQKLIIVDVPSVFHKLQDSLFRQPLAIGSAAPFVDPHLYHNSVVFPTEPQAMSERHRAYLQQVRDGLAEVVPEDTRLLLVFDSATLAGQVKQQAMFTPNKRGLSRADSEKIRQREQAFEVLNKKAGEVQSQVEGLLFSWTKEPAVARHASATFATQRSNKLKALYRNIVKRDALLRNALDIIASSNALVVSHPTLDDVQHVFPRATYTEKVPQRPSDLSAHSQTSFTKAWAADNSQVLQATLTASVTALYARTEADTASGCFARSMEGQAVFMSWDSDFGFLAAAQKVPKVICPQPSTWAVPHEVEAECFSLQVAQTWLCMDTPIHRFLALTLCGDDYHHGVPGISYRRNMAYRLSLCDSLDDVVATLRHLIQGDPKQTLPRQWLPVVQQLACSITEAQLVRFFSAHAETARRTKLSEFDSWRTIQREDPKEAQQLARRPLKKANKPRAEPSDIKRHESQWPKVKAAELDAGSTDDKAWRTMQASFPLQIRGAKVTRDPTSGERQWSSTLPNSKLETLKSSIYTRSEAEPRPGAHDTFSKKTGRARKVAQDATRSFDIQPKVTIRQERAALAEQAMEEASLTVRKVDPQHGKGQNANEISNESGDQGDPPTSMPQDEDEYEPPAEDDGDHHHSDDAHDEEFANLVSKQLDAAAEALRSNSPPEDTQDGGSPDKAQEGGSSGTKNKTKAPKIFASPSVQSPGRNFAYDSTTLHLQTAFRDFSPSANKVMPAFFQLLHDSRCQDAVMMQVLSNAFLSQIRQGVAYTSITHLMQPDPFFKSLSRLFDMASEQHIFSEFDEIPSSRLDDQGIERNPDETLSDLLLRMLRQKHPDIPGAALTRAVRGLSVATVRKAFKGLPTVKKRPKVRMDVEIYAHLSLPVLQAIEEVYVSTPAAAFTETASPAISWPILASFSAKEAAAKKISSQLLVRIRLHTISKLKKILVKICRKPSYGLTLSQSVKAVNEVGVLVLDLPLGEPLTPEVRGRLYDALRSHVKDDAILLRLVNDLARIYVELAAVAPSTDQDVCLRKLFVAQAKATPSIGFTLVDKIFYLSEESYLRVHYMPQVHRMSAFDLGQVLLQPRSAIDRYVARHNHYMTKAFRSLQHSSNFRPQEHRGAPTAVFGVKHLRAKKLFVDACPLFVRGASDSSRASFLDELQPLEVAETRVSDLERHCAAVVDMTGLNKTEFSRAQHVTKIDIVFSTERCNPLFVPNGAVSLAPSSVTLHGFRLSRHKPSSLSASVAQQPTCSQAFAHELRLSTCSGDGTSLVRPDLVKKRKNALWYHWVRKEKGSHPEKISETKGVHPLMRDLLTDLYSKDEIRVDGEWARVPIFTRFTSSWLSKAVSAAKRNKKIESDGRLVPTFIPYASPSDHPLSLLELLHLKSSDASSGLHPRSEVKFLHEKTRCQIPLSVKQAKGDDWEQELNLLKQSLPAQDQDVSRATAPWWKSNIVAVDPGVEQPSAIALMLTPRGAESNNLSDKILLWALQSRQPRQHIVKQAQRKQQASSHSLPIKGAAKPKATDSWSHNLVSALLTSVEQRSAIDRKRQQLLQRDVQSYAHSILSLSGALPSRRDTPSYAQLLAPLETRAEIFFGSGLVAPGLLRGRRGLGSGTASAYNAEVAKVVDQKHLNAHLSIQDEWGTSSRVAGVADSLRTLRPGTEHSPVLLIPSLILAKDDLTGRETRSIVMIRDINHPLHRDLVAATNILFANVHEKRFGFHPFRPAGQAVRSNEDLADLP